MENQQGRGAHIWAEETFQNTWLFQLVGVPYKSINEWHVEVVRPSVCIPVSAPI